ncbi:hypothetical protein PLUTO_00920 [Luteibacter phage vB_LflM-Pluto]|uniref:DNA-binding protein n=1 Tax=Luteibacter phage vB_LflM-Pluto TaxID=2948611 RepID=A0A9E7MTU9_9CAUD|nr:hypothetical protein PLUTO_00920 [Luteibacter phage vB_LflM-Pluto]
MLIPSFSTESNVHELIRQWGEDRNLIKGATPRRQFLKLMSEAGEIGDAISKGHGEGIKDGIGDTFVVLVIITSQLGLNVADLRYDQVNVSAYAYAPVDAIYALLLDKLTLLGLYLTSDDEEEAKKLAPSTIAGAVNYLNLLAAAHGFWLEDAAKHAYEEIKDRKGVMYEGTFVKSTDSRYSDVMAKLGKEEAA